MYSQLIEWSKRNPLTRRAVAAFSGQRPPDDLASALRGESANLNDIGKFIVGHVTPMRAPLVLISQVHRSGGTLLSQLFDGHPMLAAYPNELKIGHPTPENWPPIRPEEGAEKCFHMLYEPRDIRFLRKGYSKGERGEVNLPFFSVPSLHYRIFRSLFEAASPRSQRDVIDLYFTAYFHAWLNYQGDLSQKKWITAFAPRFAQYEASVAGFFAAYGDGKLIQIVRDPRTWYPSAKHHNSNKKRANPDDIQGLLDLWLASANSILTNKQRFGDKVIVLTFERLVSDTESALRAMAGQLGINFDPSMLVPTFNGRSMVANSSFEVQGAGVSAAPLKREKLLGEAERDAIERHCVTLYEKVAALDDLAR